jgi:3-mercaptopropionate dioxygenase
VPGRPIHKRSLERYWESPSSRDTRSTASCLDTRGSRLPIGEIDVMALRELVLAMGGLLERHPAEEDVLDEGSEHLRRLLDADGWLPDELARPDTETVAQYLLHCDSARRFCVLALAWAPGQATPVHDHTTWGLVGVWRGAESVRHYRTSASGVAPHGPWERFERGEIDRVTPTGDRDVHQVRNAVDDVSISIHIYGADIGALRRSLYRPDGTVEPRVTGYANRTLPNIWGPAPA